MPHYPPLYKRVLRSTFLPQKNVTVKADVDVQNGTLVLHSQRNGVTIDGNITSTQDGNLTIKAGSWVNIHKNITLGMGF